MKKQMTAAHLVIAGAALLVAAGTSVKAQDLIISTVSGSAPSAPNNELDTAAPIVLDEFGLNSGGTVATPDATLTLPVNNISGEYGSASEGIIQDSVNGQYLTMMGYGVNYSTFNNAGGVGYGTAALGQTTSLTGGANTTVPRVVALIGANGSVDTTTQLTGIYNTNNPRSATTVDGSSFYTSGQSVTGDGLGGVFYATKGATTATAIDTSTETRVVSIINNGSGNTLYVSRDAKGAGGGNNNTTDIRTETASGGGLPTSAATAAIIVPGVASVNGGNTASIDLVAGLDNNVNSSRNGKFVYLSPEQYFFANSTTMYVTDSGAPKNGSANAAALGEGGLQKWDLVSGKWTLQYDLYQGLNLVNNAGANSATNTAPGVTGLFGLTGKVVGGNVQLFATSYGLNELSPSYLYSITDTLSDTTSTQASGETFTTLYSGPTGTSIRGVAFGDEAAPEPSTTSLLALAGLAGAAYAWTRKNAKKA